MKKTNPLAKASCQSIEKRRDIFRSFLRRRTKVRQRKRTEKGNKDGLLMPVLRLFVPVICFLVYITFFCKILLLLPVDRVCQCSEAVSNETACFLNARFTVLFMCEAVFMTAKLSIHAVKDRNSSFPYTRLLINCLRRC